jgi:chromosomal replication initiation ATPase DnaA
MAAADQGVAVETVLASGRGRAPVARARQLAIYLAHVGFGHGLRRCAAMFGRDRTTARHAVRCVEDWRDDPHVDDRISELERRARAIEGVIAP